MKWKGYRLPAYRLEGLLLGPLIAFGAVIGFAAVGVLFGVIGAAGALIPWALGAAAATFIAEAVTQISTGKSMLAFAEEILPGKARDHSSLFHLENSVKAAVRLDYLSNKENNGQFAAPHLQALNQAVFGNDENTIYFGLNDNGETVLVENGQKIKLADYKGKIDLRVAQERASDYTENHVMPFLEERQLLEDRVLSLFQKHGSYTIESDNITKSTSDNNPIHAQLEKALNIQLKAFKYEETGQYYLAPSDQKNAFPNQQTVRNALKALDGLEAELKNIRRIKAKLFHSGAADKKTGIVNGKAKEELSVVLNDGEEIKQIDRSNFEIQSSGKTVESLDLRLIRKIEPLQKRLATLNESIPGKESSLRRAA